MKKTIFKIVCAVTVLLMLAGCGKEEAQEILLQESAAQKEAEDTKEDDGDLQPEVTQVIQVECQCQCQTGASSEESASDTEPQESAQSASDGKININTADSAQLQTLSGIGEVRAQAIISYRETYGAFQSIEEIKNVSGIKDAVFDKIKDDISVG